MGGVGMWVQMSAETRVLCTCRYRCLQSAEGADWACEFPFLLRTGQLCALKHRSLLRSEVGGWPVHSGACRIQAGAVCM